jgi:hypothetical protein
MNHPSSFTMALSRQQEQEVMVYLLLRHSVLGYPRWKELFDIDFPARQAGGATNQAIVLRNVDDPNEIIVLLGWRDLATARTFSHSVSWQMALKTMGVVGVPEVGFWETV